MTKKRITTRATALFSAVAFESPLPELTARRLTPADIAQAVALTAEAGWNQIAADWQLMLDQGDGLGLFSEGRLIATAIVLPYDAPAPPGSAKFAWISMVLVTPNWQRRGLARWMLERCIAVLQEAGYMPMLDATPAGRALYRKLGFTDGFEIQRLEAAEWGGLPVQTGGYLFMPLSTDQIGDAVGLDRSAFCADRTGIVASIRQRNRPAYVAERNGVVDGFALVREGQRAWHVGPIVARAPALAPGLLFSMGMYLQSRPVFLDALSHNTAFVDALLAAGFKLQRKFTRMHLGPKAPAMRQDQYFAIAGPELG